MESQNMDIDVSDLASVVYFVNVTTTNGLMTKKLIVQ